MNGTAGRIARLVAGLIAVAYVVVLALLLFWLVNVTGLPLCPSGTRTLVILDECIDASATARTIGLVLGWASAATALATMGLAVQAARGRSVAGRLGAVALATPVLAVAGLVLVPVSF